MQIKHVAVLGSGIMGHGIAQVSAVAGYQVYLRDVEEGLLQKALANMEKSLGRMVKAGKLPQEEIPVILNRIKTTTDLEAAVKEADLVVEAIPENLELKKAPFRIWTASVSPKPSCPATPPISASPCWLR
jgi:3-hydroxyacyl-CoA dehydrogenase